MANANFWRLGNLLYWKLDFENLKFNFLFIMNIDNLFIRMILKRMFMRFNEIYKILILIFIQIFLGFIYFIE